VKEMLLKYAQLSFMIASALLVMPLSLSAEPFKMVYNSDWPPFSVGTGNSVDGILPDLLQHLLANRMGIEATHKGYPWKRAQHSVKSGKLDALVTVPTSQRLEWSKSSESIVYLVEMRAVVKRGSKADQALSANPDAAALNDFKVCEILGNGWGLNFMKTNSIRYNTASDTSRCLDMISKGRMDVTIGSIAVSSQKIREMELDDELRILPNTYGSMAFTLLVSKKTPEADEFLKRFDDLIAQMKADGSLSKLIADLRSKQR
jgi:polar amino acid transport system substrate-binding protein